MKNIKKIHNFYSEKLVQKVNELYFDFTNEEYVCTHPEIIKQTKERWERIAKQFLHFNNPITVVDIGTGTGFVPLIAAKFLKKEDLFICSDISKGILDTANRNIDRNNFHCQFEFTKIKSQVPYKLPFETESMDIVTINSVLHHIKDTTTFLDEINRILKVNGLLFIAHEPNKYFFENKFLFYNYYIISHLFNPKDIIYQVFEKIRLKKMLEQIYYFIHPKKKGSTTKHKKITDRINEKLLQEKIIEKALLPGEIGAITDIRAQEGFKPDSLLPHYKLLHLETYNHMYWVNIRHINNFLIKKYNSLLEKKYPEKGSSFFAVFRK